MILSEFEFQMSLIFHELYGSNTDNIKEQAWWEKIQTLKKLAQKEVINDNKTDT